MVVEERRNLFSRYVNGRTFSQGGLGFWERIKVDMKNSYCFNPTEIKEIKPNLGQAIIYCKIITLEILLVLILCSFKVFYRLNFSRALKSMAVNSLTSFLLVFVFLMILAFSTALLLKNFILDENNVQTISFVRMSLHSKTTFPLILFLTTLLRNISEIFDPVFLISPGIYFFISDYHIKEALRKSKMLTSTKQNVFVTILTLLTSTFFFLLCTIPLNKVFSW